MKTTNTIIRAFIPYKNQRGMSLIEIMVALVIAMFMLGGIIQIVVGNKQTYRVQDSVARMQENGRFSLHFLTKDVRMAGFMGCSSPGGGMTVNNNVDPTDPAWSTGGRDPAAVAAAIGGFTNSDAIQGYTYDGVNLATELSDMGLTAGTAEGDLVPDTDILFIRRAVSCPGNGIESHNNNTAQLFMDNTQCGIQQYEVVLVSNCQTADIFGVTNVVNNGGNDNIAHGSNLNLAPQLPNGYGPGANMYRMESEVFFIGWGASGEPALYKNALEFGVGVKRELVEGIEDMEILYGEDTSGDGIPNIYSTAGSVTNMDAVVSLRITTTSRTVEDNITSDVTADGDYRLRRDFTTTIGIRNRMS